RQADERRRQKQDVRLQKAPMQDRMRQTQAEDLENRAADGDPDDDAGDQPAVLVAASPLPDACQRGPQSWKQHCGEKNRNRSPIQPLIGNRQQLIEGHLASLGRRRHSQAPCSLAQWHSLWLIGWTQVRWREYSGTAVGPERSALRRRRLLSVLKLKIIGRSIPSATGSLGRRRK